MKDNYSDIINLPHYEPSIRHPRMTIENRAAQFAPFAALTGHSDEIKETARLTDKRIEIDEGLKTMLNSKLRIIQNNINTNPEIIFTYFVPDKKKSGGKYIEKTGNVKRIDIIEQYVLLTDKTKIPISEIIAITSKVLEFENN